MCVMCVCMSVCVCVYLWMYVLYVLCVCCVCVSVGKQTELKRFPFNSASQVSTNISSIKDKKANVSGFVRHTVTAVTFHFYNVQGFQITSAKKVMANK